MKLLEHIAIKMKALTLKPVTKISICSTLLLLLTPWVAHAIPISTDISISGSVTYDIINSDAVGTTQSGSISSTIGGSPTSSSISGATLSGTNPLSGNLIDIGDGFGSSFSMSGDQNGDRGNLFSDYSFNITNNSATDQYQVIFAINFNNFANADGTDAFADSQISITNETASAEVFFSDLTSDVFFGDKENGISLASFGASLSDSGTLNLELLLNPLGVIDLSGINELKGDVFDNMSQFNGELSSFISVASVVNLTNPPTVVPVPAAVWLFGSGLLGLVGIAKRKKAA
jgi:hypothetical protein